ncbi:MAG TPA: VOC family protein [Thermodesulfobacteriota bacterium]|nr:VOC family protein [Thermodesulfobacteriota bacterium]
MIKVTKFAHVGLWVKDIERSVRFYRDILGFQVSDVVEAKEGRDGTYVFMRHGTDHHSLLLCEMSRERAAMRPAQKTELQHLSFEVADREALKRALAFLKAQGVEIYRYGKHDPGGNYYIDFFDPDGNRVEIQCEMEQIGWDGRAKPKELWAPKHGTLD